VKLDLRAVDLAYDGWVSSVNHSCATAPVSHRFRLSAFPSGGKAPAIHYGIKSIVAWIGQPSRERVYESSAAEIAISAAELSSGGFDSGAPLEIGQAENQDQEIDQVGQGFSEGGAAIIAK
jgi:hypothetical protein